MEKGRAQDISILNKETLEDKVNADVLIVLGAGGFNWINYSRVRQAAKYDSKILIYLTGGKERLSPWVKKSEAEVMRKQLIKLGIKDRKIALETEAESTRENFSKSREFLYLLQNIKNIGVVTNPAHMERALEYARQELPEYNLIPVPVQPDKWDIRSKLANIVCSMYEKLKLYKVGYKNDKKN